MKNYPKPIKSLAKISLLVLAGLSSAGCITSHSYVDPQYHHASFDDMQRVAPPYALSVKVEFQRNGVDRPGVDRQIQDHVERTLRASGAAVPYEGKGTAAGELMFIMNNVVAIGGAAAKGFGTGLTLGLVGSHVTDNYEFTIRLTQKGDVFERPYQHAILTTVGNASGPPGQSPIPLGTAVDRIVDDALLNFLKDAQSAGKLITQTP